MSSPLQRLNGQGINLQAVFDLADLPPDMQAVLGEAVADIAGYRQLHLFGHGGRLLWEQVQASPFAAGEHPIDRFSEDAVRRYMEEAVPGCRYTVIFPAGKRLVPLRRLGELAGWHFDSPFRVGINNRWGSWFAYRVVVLADSNLPVTPKVPWRSPCDACDNKPCLAACPGAALVDGRLELDRCIDYRLADGSRCSRQCISRLACPAAPEHRYEPAQIDYCYGLSLETIRQWRQGAGST